ncbi:hypothetical protein [Hyphomicrobium denitrificans]|uniref:hypothetical protein n=1 Tax=Hyphomicrobium denitrificans TaxID=53399 RepID=UPI0002F116C1|nr:hypothetical protein [Hyphomicrobium denitrificans]
MSRQGATRRARQLGNLGDVPCDGLRGDFVLNAKRRFLSQAIKLAVLAVALDAAESAGVLIADDLLKASEAHSPTARESCINWFNQTIHSRFDNPKKRKIIVVAQRLHAEDLPGHLIAKGGWEELILPAIHSEKKIYDIVSGGWRVWLGPGHILQRSRHDKEDLEQLKKDMGEHDFEAQYNQCPLPPGGYIFKSAWVKRYQKAPGPAKVEAIIQSWDTAYQGDETNSYTVCTTWAKCHDDYYLLDVWRDRLNFVDLVNQVYALKEKWNAKLVIVEKKASGISLLEVINQNGNQKWLLSREPEKGRSSVRSSRR